MPFHSCYCLLSKQPARSPNKCLYRCRADLLWVSNLHSRFATKSPVLAVAGRESKGGLMSPLHSSSPILVAPRGWFGPQHKSDQPQGATYGLLCWPDHRSMECSGHSRSSFWHIFNTRGGLEGLAQSWGYGSLMPLGDFPTPRESPAGSLSQLYVLLEQCKGIILLGRIWPPPWRMNLCYCLEALIPLPGC